MSPPYTQPGVFGKVPGFDNSMPRQLPASINPDKKPHIVFIRGYWRVTRMPKFVAHAKKAPWLETHRVLNNWNSPRNREDRIAIKPV